MVGMLFGHGEAYARLDPARGGRRCLAGLLLSGVVVAKRNNKTANRLLAALLAAFTLYLASSVYYAVGLIRVYPHFFGVSYFLPWISGRSSISMRSQPVIARGASSDANSCTSPVAISVAIAAPYFMMSGAAKIAMYERIVGGDIPARLVTIDPFKYVSGMAYSIATIVYLRKHRRRIEDSYSNTTRVNLGWLLWLAAAAAGIWVLAMTIRVTVDAAWVRDEQVTLAIALLVYAVGYAGLRQPEIFRYETAEHPVPSAPIAMGVQETTTVKPSAPRYQRSGLGDDEAAELKGALLALMDRDRPWADSELTLADLASRLGTTPHKLSEVLNGEIEQTFYDFVNVYRVRDVQRRIHAGEARTRKMLALAFDAGFASKSTFNQVFKKHTNQTPSDFSKISRS